MNLFMTKQSLFYLS